jgi:hypothetical protein
MALVWQATRHPSTCVWSVPGPHGAFVTKVLIGRHATPMRVSVALVAYRWPNAANKPALVRLQRAVVMNLLKASHETMTAASRLGSKVLIEPTFTTSAPPVCLGGTSIARFRPSRSKPKNATCDSRADRLLADAQTGT